MEIQSFAQQILEGDRLEDKLLLVESLDQLTDARPGAPVALPEAPGRPDCLDLRKKRPKVAFPSLHQLEDPTARGHVLHFFANHELLALELMALALLRFPDAPPSLRRGLVGTMLEEQAHLRLYLAQMQQVGVSLGQIPVNRYFWDAISGMRSPQEFIACMSLTFEQANLDYAASYAQAFAQVGAADTAQVLRRVFEEEIGHVGHGVKWLKRWRLPQESLFEAYCRLLPSPLTASRARGKTLHVGARLQAGLPQSFIDQLEVFGASRGRPPQVHWFNPSCEAEVARGKAVSPRQPLVEMARDLELLPVLLAGEDDVVVVQRSPSQAALRSLRQAGLSLPQLVLKEPGQRLHLEHAHLGALRPWGWSPAMADQLRHLAPRVGHAPSLSLLAAPWTQQRRQLYAKTWSCALLAQLLEEAPTAWWSPPELVGRAVHSPQEALEACQRLLEQGHGWAVLKAPWGTSGRGALRVERARWSPGQEGWAQRTLRQQGALVVEPWLEKVADLSLLLQVPAQGQARQLGLTRFVTDARGQYLGTWLAQATWGLPAPVRRWLQADGQEPRRLPLALERIAAFVGEALQRAGHRGPAGVDMMIHEHRGQFFLKPIVEINPRHTMGHVALALHSRLARGRVGLWRLLPWRSLQGQWASPKAWASFVQERCPLQVAQQGRQARWSQGALLVCDPEAVTQVLPLLLVGRDQGELERRAQELGLPPLAQR